MEVGRCKVIDGNGQRTSPYRYTFPTTHKEFVMTDTTLTFVAPSDDVVMEELPELVEPPVEVVAEPVVVEVVKNSDVASDKAVFFVRFANGITEGITIDRNLANARAKHMTEGAIVDFVQVRFTEKTCQWKRGKGWITK
jgi:hypothetical protein